MKYIQRTIIILILTALFINSKAQEVLESYRYDYFIINTDNTIESSSAVYNDSNFLLLTMGQGWYIYDSRFIKKQIYFTQGTDTMQVFCFCFSHTNFYFKNFKFKKGSYFVSFIRDETNIISGDSIMIPSKFQSIVFRDLIALNEQSAVLRKDIIRKDGTINDMKFNIIDFSDTINVKLVPLNEEEFWENSFLPKNKN